jgi:outer membrane lipoprotein-sorting protein
MNAESRKEHTAGKRVVGARFLDSSFIIHHSSLVFLLCLALPAPAQTTARALLDQTRQLNQTTRKWSDRVQRLQLRIVDRRGGERSRELVTYFKKYPQDRNRTMLVFESPPEVKGVGFLQWADPHAKDEQWLYLPELKRVRQISTSAKHESFVGTDFSYDDLAIISQIGDWAETDARTNLLRDEPVDEHSCHVIEFTPAGKDLSYGKILAWLRADDLVMAKFEMYDNKARLEKQLLLGGIRAVGAIPTAFHMEMKNVQGGSHTVVDFTAVKYDTGLDDSRFTQRALEHGP